MDNPLAGLTTEELLTQAFMHLPMTARDRLIGDEQWAEIRRRLEQAERTKAELRSIISNLAKSLFPNSPPESAEAEFYLDAAGACQVIERRTQQAERMRKALEDITSEIPSATTVDGVPVVSLEAYWALQRLARAALDQPNAGGTSPNRVCNGVEPLDVGGAF